MTRLPKPAVRGAAVLRGPDRRHLGHRPRVLRPRLRHEARHRIRARRPDDGADRELLLIAVLAKLGQDRPPEGALPAADRRLGGRAREHDHRSLGTVGDLPRACRVRRRAARPAGAGRYLGARPPGCVRSGNAADEQTARRAYDLLAEGFGPGFNGPIPIVVDVNGDPDAPQRVYDGVQGSTASRPSANRSSTMRRRSPSSS